jgi:3-oxoacyl-[acyl-carrier protein] reductase
MNTAHTTGDTMRVKDKSIIVTGAGSGIGEGIAKRLAAQGAKVMVNDINTALGAKVVASIVQAGGTAAFFAADVTQSADVKALVAAAVQHAPQPTCARRERG